MKIWLTPSAMQITINEERRIHPIIFERNPLVVCDGWTEPKHPRKVLKDGDPARVSHGLCAECDEAMR